MIKKKLWIVKREVIAESIEKAIRTRGNIYEISEAADQSKVQGAKKDIGFKK